MELHGVGVEIAGQVLVTVGDNPEDPQRTLGKMSFRRAGRMHHLGVGYAHARTRILAIADDTTVTVIALETGEILSTHHIEPTKSYWRNTQKDPGRWPGPS